MSAPENPASVESAHTPGHWTKVVHSGQVRLYYAAACSCGWRSERFRVTKERASEDHQRHKADQP